MPSCACRHPATEVRSMVPESARQNRSAPITSPVTRYTRDFDDFTAAFDTFLTRELTALAGQTGLRPGDPVPADLAAFVRSRSAELGFYAAEYPEKAGGQGAPFAAKVLLHEAAEHSGCPLAPLALANANGPTPLLLHATEEQQERYLRPLVAAEAVRCLAVTEPGGGSDILTPATRARRVGGSGSVGGDWVLDGEKCFVSNAHEADFVFVFARLDQDEPGPASQTGIFVVDAGTPGLLIGPPQPGLGSDLLADVRLDGVRLPPEALLGPADSTGPGAGSHRAWMASALARGRVIVAAVCNGMAALALDLGIEFVRGRRSLGSPLGAHQHVQEHIVSSRLRLETSRLLTFTAAQAAGAAVGTPEAAGATELAAMAKLAASEGACETVDRMLQVHGAAAWVRGHPIEYLHRQVRGMRLVEGTSEIQKVILAEAEGLW